MPVEKALKERLQQLEQEKNELLNKIETLHKENELLKEKNKDLLAFSNEFHNREKSERYKMATVLFCEIKGFSTIQEQTDSTTLMDELDNFFLFFDNIVKKYNIQKIKSIGDTYICAGGIPVKNRTNPIEVIFAALEVQHFFSNMKARSNNQSLKSWNLSFGIHTGPVFSYITGSKKISFEIKGETVNIASRIKSSCESGKINISGMTHEIVEEFFRCEYIGKLPVKYEGDISMYMVKGLSPEYSSDTDGLMLTPNKKFNIKFGLIRYDDLEEYMLTKLEKELPVSLYYHNLKHTIDVCIQVELIGRGEGITDEELLLLKTAALFHDAGHIINSVNHEFHSTTIAREILPCYYYTENQINTISEIIMATKLPPKPKNLLEEIICDADLDYLGRSDFIPVSNTLYKELSEQKLIGSLDDWNILQIKFISGHHYFTKTANSLREVNKQKQIERLKKLVTS